jgi:hypothetical protein
MKKLHIILFFILYSCQVHQERKQEAKAELSDTQKQEIYTRLYKKQHSLENKNYESVYRLINLLKKKSEKHDLSIIYAINDSVYKIAKLLDKKTKELYFLSVYNNNYKKPKFKNKPLNVDFKEQVIKNIQQLHVFLNKQSTCGKVVTFDKQEVINSKSIDCMIIITHKQKLLAEFHQCILYDMLSKYDAI